MNDLIEMIHRWIGPRLGDMMLQLFEANNTHIPTSEAEVSGYYKEIMLNREVRP